MDWRWNSIRRRRARSVMHRSGPPARAAALRQRAASIHARSPEDMQQARARRGRRRRTNRAQTPGWADGDALSLMDCTLRNEGCGRVGRGGGRRPARGRGRDYGHSQNVRHGSRAFENARTATAGRVIVGGSPRPLVRDSEPRLLVRGDAFSDRARAGPTRPCRAAQTCAAISLAHVSWARKWRRQAPPPASAMTRRGGSRSRARARSTRARRS